MKTNTIVIPNRSEICAAMNSIFSLEYVSTKQLGHNQDLYWFLLTQWTRHNGSLLKPKNCASLAGNQFETMSSLVAI